MSLKDESGRTHIELSGGLVVAAVKKVFLVEAD